jgi:hypothetical protein
MSLPADYFDVATALVARLRAQVPQVRSVRTASSLAELAHMTPEAPSLIVCWDGDSLPAPAECLQPVEQRWIVALTVRSARDTAGGSGVLEVAGPLMSLTLAALMGWRPALPGAGRLRRIDAPRPAFDVGYGVFPLAFSLRRSFTLEVASCA